MGRGNTDPGGDRAHERGNPKRRRDDGHAEARRHRSRGQGQREIGGLGVRLSAEGSPTCEIDNEASTHLFVSRV